ncbi:hypothetical protein CCAN11_2200005 [Capnocytophaga canimorsus]|uniref:Calcineurin-like phosphoesterase domain-containing protein n=1 Tax=Capnocytophaga canimorsus TaxID=28188 RepID=A0A0B7IJM5_9FLAO|nr:hypothetical protein CCAN11_2200005 [Capnocytophaga canimorsus]
MRTLVIGDIHGAYKALVQVLERAKIQKDDFLIFLGVLCRWLESNPRSDSFFDKFEIYQ